MSNERKENLNITLHFFIVRFPQHKESIKEMYAGSVTFREICADYEEIANWLEKHCPPEEHPSANCDYAAEVLRELETEIIGCLEKENQMVNAEMKILENER